jgi:hypothetical protein
MMTITGSGAMLFSALLIAASGPCKAQVLKQEPTMMNRARSFLLMMEVAPGGRSSKLAPDLLRVL